MLFNFHRRMHGYTTLKAVDFSSSLHTHIFVLPASRNWENGGCLLFEHKFFNYKHDIAINNKKRHDLKIRSYIQKLILNIVLSFR